MKIIGIFLAAIAIAVWVSAQDLPPVDREPVTIDSTREVDIVTRDNTAVRTTARATLLVARTAFCREVDGREPAGEASEFAADIGRIYFWSNITNSGDSTQVTHVWYSGNSERARVRLAIDNIRNRVWSSKGIAPGDTGIWRVEIWGPDSVVLAADTCRIKAE